MAALDRLNGLASETTLGIKAPCAVATTANITLSGIQTIDGVSVGSASERVLVKNQTDTTTNGIYIASSGNWTYAQDAGGNTDWTAGTLVYVQQGTVSAGLVYAQTTAAPVTIGTSAIVFAVQGAISAMPPPATRTVTATPITVTAADQIMLVDTVTINAAVSVVLPAASTMTGLRPVTIKDLTGGAGAHNITITPNGSEKIDGLSSIKISGNYGAFTIKPITTGGWAIL